ncbi:hypothetical protein M569_09693 [Genlisea aurea]|uniref:Uncharacterized protein n=1 Tax=Genlisea aurea TaxID=192259 RepID=S8DYJ9_9LAMI|nr:hypothetical protein M569_09693 [Genlisea aurea]
MGVVAISSAVCGGGKPYPLDSSRCPVVFKSRPPASDMISGGGDDGESSSASSSSSPVTSTSDSIPPPLPPRLEFEHPSPLLREGHSVPVLVKEYIESIWIFKVLGSFGLMLPAILLSMLFATGPKAFLMALAVPIGHSTFSFAVAKFQQRSSHNPPPTDEEEKQQTRIPDRRPDPDKRRKASASSSLRGWDDDDDKANTGGSVHFGGWDEVIHFTKVSSSVKKRGRRNSRRRSEEEEEEITVRQKKKKVLWDENVGSLLMRLLVFVLPLVSKWIEMMLFSKDSYT